MTGKGIKKDTSKRKKEHVVLVLNEDVGFRNKATGFDFFEFEHNALPELNTSEIDTSIKFLGKKIKFPLMVSCMTGGYKNAKLINQSLAAVCEERGIPFGVGSQRQVMEDASYHRTFSIVRKVAPNIPIIGNIGAAEIANLKNTYQIQKLVDMIDADAFAIHLNPLQEFLQPEGDTNFYGVLKGIELIVRNLSVPVIVKEVGAGISASVAQRLINVGVKMIDTAGAGGTSWAGIEIIRSNKPWLSSAFWDWGIPTAESISSIRKLFKNIFLIGSGGIRTGIDMAKSIALGANLAAAAAPILKSLEQGGEKQVEKVLNLWEKELRGAMFLTGSRNISQLRKAKLLKIN
jgi:isopentenyl-diphosphate delta-isomerase